MSDVYICIIQEHWWMTVHESVVEIQIWSIISGNWNMNLYELPMIFSSSYQVTSLVEWWNLSIYKGKTIHYLTKQIHYSNFESLIYVLIVRFSINWILKIQFSKLVWYATQLCISVSSYIVMNFHSILLKSKTKKRIFKYVNQFQTLKSIKGFHNHAVIPIYYSIFIYNLNHNI